jgi:hypothetical protein
MFFERKVNTLKKRLNQAFFYFLSYKQSSISSTMTIFPLKSRIIVILCSNFPQNALSF